MTHKNYDEMSDDGIRIIGGAKKEYFCRAFAANCPFFEDFGMCIKENCAYADENIPSADEMLRLQLLEIRRTQLKMTEISYRDRGIPMLRFTPKTR